ncbi:hypothetical protein HYZ76_00685 [Candidatus Falkowbacteria bacterium]|nr:hypothetical protein [Candidatus Falkowbacteria bacterium]
MKINISPNNHWFKILISICLVLITVSVIHYIFIFLPEQRDFSRAEARRFECKQDVQTLINDYSAAISGLEPNEENQQAIFSYALSLGIIDQAGNTVPRSVLLQRCLDGQL